MNASGSVASVTHLHEEANCKLMTQLCQRQNRTFIENVLCTMYLDHHLEVLATENGLFFMLVRICDLTFLRFHTAQTDSSFFDNIVIF